MGRAAERGDLYAVDTHVFPAWQFAGGRMLPHLAEVLAALPEDLHPLEVERFMTWPNEALGEQSPVHWLLGGGDPALVLRLADEQAWV